MKSSSAKQKGRALQQWTRGKILEINPELSPEDVKSTSMGAQGEDIQLSIAARQRFPFSVEAKSRAAISVYPWYEQASHSKYEPILVIKGNAKKPLVVIDAEVFIKIIRKAYNEN